VTKTVIVLVQLVLPNIGRLAVARYSILVGNTTGKFFAGFDNYLSLQG
jgi:hypothetical protein